MKLVRIETSDTVRRLAGRTERRGAQTGFSVFGACAFGGVFVITGSVITLVGMRIIPVDPAGVHAPWWVLTVIGVVFALCGLGVWGMALRQQRREAYRAKTMEQYPDSPAMKDYPWDPRGFTPPRWSGAFKALGGAIVFTLFIAVFNYFAFWTKTPVWVKAVVVLFDLILLAAWWETLAVLMRAWKFARTCLEFSQFPCPRGQPLSLRWRTDGDIQTPRQATFTLRCIEEWHEHHGSGKDRNVHLVHEEKWSAVWHGERTRPFLPGERVELRFEPPPELPATCLSAGRPVFWELEVHLDLAGADFRGTYLVPVY